MWFFTIILALFNYNYNSPTFADLERVKTQVVYQLLWIVALLWFGWWFGNKVLRWICVHFSYRFLVPTHLRLHDAPVEEKIVHQYSDL